MAGDDITFVPDISVRVVAPVMDDLVSFENQGFKVARIAVGALDEPSALHVLQSAGFG